MFDFHSLAEFSRANCISICAFLVPANLLATIVTMIFAALNRPLQQVRLSAGVACCFAFVMVLHVYTWFMIGVVMPPTFILLSLAVTCLLANIGAILFHRRKIHATSFGN